VHLDGSSDQWPELGRSMSAAPSFAVSVLFTPRSAPASMYVRRMRGQLATVRHRLAYDYALLSPK
jgi:hypothetical protein